MTTRIQFDIKALEALFPEGSEARVDLQRNVASALLSKLAISDVQRLSAENREEAVKVSKEVCTQMGIVTKWQGDIHLDQRVKAAIAKATKEAAEAEIRNAVAEAVKAQLPQIEAMVAENIQTRVHQAGGVALRGTIREVVRSMFSNMGATGL